MSSKQPLAQPANVVFLYDGSFDGFLCCVYHCVYTRQLPMQIALIEQAQPSFFEERTIPTEYEQAQKVRQSIPKKISTEAFQMVQTVFLSDAKEKEIDLIKFLLLGYQKGASVTKMLGHPDVAPVIQAEKRLLGEAHLLKGFVRFSEYEGVLISQITPKNFILPFLAEHFSQRYSEEKFLIYDKTHKAALTHDEKGIKIVPLDVLTLQKEDDKEQEYRSLWKQFYNTVSIEARYNPKCRMTHMPKRYWENMTEMAEHL